MTEDSFILINLKEKDSKTIAQVLANETSRKILDYLATIDEATESDMAKELKIPLSTVHYNLKHLKKAKLIDVDEFHYSPKGKEVDHYKLANKLVIIAPAKSKVEDLRAKLGKILPTFLVSAVGAFLVYVFGSMFTKSMGASDMMLAAPLAQESAKMVADEAGEEAMPMIASRSADMVVHQAPLVVQSVPDSLTIAIWFFVGAMFAVICMGIFGWVWQKYSRK